MKTIIILCFLLIPAIVPAYTLEGYWPDENIVQDRDDAARCLNYQDEIEDVNNPGEMIPNPVSKVTTIKKRLRQQLRDWIECGAAMQEAQDDQGKLDAVNERTEGITFE